MRSVADLQCGHYTGSLLGFERGEVFAGGEEL
jgi:hypothetical protein